MIYNVFSNLITGKCSLLQLFEANNVFGHYNTKDYFIVLTRSFQEVQKPKTPYVGNIITGFIHSHYFFKHSKFIAFKMLRLVDAAMGVFIIFHW